MRVQIFFTFLRRVRMPRILAVAVPLCAAGALAQSPASDPLAPQCPAGAAPVIDSGIVTVQLSAGQHWRGRKYSAAQRTRILYYADAIQRHFEPPATLGAIPIFGALRTKRDASEPPGYRVAVSGRLVLVAKEDGRLGVQAWAVTPQSATFANAITRAVVVADSGDAFGDMPPVGPKDGDTLSLEIVSRSVPVEGEPTLMRARVPAYVASSGAAISAQRPPDYPERARAARAEGEGEISFIVGSDAHVPPSSVQVTRADVVDFAEPMRQAILTATYRAGISGGCRLPMAVRQPFSFRLRRP